MDQPSEDFLRIKAEGESIGLHGRELAAYIKETKLEEEERKNKRKLEEEERAERKRKQAEEERKEAERERLAAEERAEQRKWEADERARQIEREDKDREERRQTREDEMRRIRLEADLRDAARAKEMEYEKEQHRMLLERNQIGIPMQAPPSAPQKDKIPLRLPFFDDKEDLECFIRTFERVAEVQKWEEEELAPRLAALLKGRAREVYSLMSDEDSKDFDKLKETLLFRFKLTADEYRKRFRTAKKQPGESTQEFATKLELYLQRWQEMAKKNKTYEDLKDLILMEKFIEAIPFDQARFVLQSSPATITEAVEKALVFETAKYTAQSTHELTKPRKDDKMKSGAVKNEPKSGGTVNKLTRPQERERVPNTCFKCHEPGHIARYCKKFNCSTVKLQGESSKEEMKPSTLCKSCTLLPFSPECEVLVEGRRTLGMRDTGSSISIVQSSLVPNHCLTGSTIDVVLAETTEKRTLPLAVVELDTPYFKSAVEVAVMQKPANPVIIGNYRKTSTGEIMPIPVYATRSTIAAVQTRATDTKKDKPLKITVTGIGGVTKEQLKEEQKKDPSLEKIRQIADTATTNKNDSSSVKSGYHWEAGMLCRYFTQNGKTHRQIVVPRKYRDEVISLAHDSPMAGHMGVKKTRARLWNDFTWPGICGDIQRYCASCDVCQRTTPKGRTKKVPMGRMPLINTPFERVAVDLIGPILPASARGHRYILTVVDYATRYAEAKPLKNMTAEDVAEALWEIWARLGVPKEILTDRGSQFVGNLAEEVNRLLNIKGLRTTPYHPQGNGLVERYNGTIKQMLRHLSQEQPKEWDRFLPALLFAIREVPQESLGFSPFELLYGRSVRGPVQILKELWTKEGENDEEEDVRTTFQYVVDLRNRIEETCRMARENLVKATKRHARNFDRRAKERSLQVGDKVLVLLSDNTNKLQMKWRGPYIVTDKVNQYDYRVDIGTSEKLYHINVLKKYVERIPQNETHIVAVVLCESEEMEEAELPSREGIPLMQLERKEGPNNAHISEECTQQQREQILKELKSHEAVLSDLPGNTPIQKCKIDMETSEPVCIKQYPIPYARVKVIGEEVNDMLKMQVIEPAASPYNAPVVIVKKKDGTNRFCIDYRKLNQTTRFDAEPLPDINQIFAKLSNKSFFSKIDLCKGYWQIQMDEQDKEKTAFSTPQGQYQWRRMPFGLKNAGAIFSRMMRKLLAPINPEFVSNFIDDILIATPTWDTHMDILRQVLRRLQECHLTAKPSKCFFGYQSLSFLGHEVGAGLVKPEAEKLLKIQAAERPKTKTEVRAFLGLAGYYRKFIANFAELALPLTDATKKGSPEVIVWTEECEKSFQDLKKKLTEKPVIVMADLTKPFVLRTDASDRGLGAVLLQEKEGVLHPVSYISKKLNDAEKNYSTIEKECLAIVWSIRKFEPYLYGTRFIIETDHRPLTYLKKSKTENGRLMRWAIQLQEYNFVVKIIPGRDNVGADYLSRSC